jgi:hypothetical protein
VCAWVGCFGRTRRPASHRDADADAAAAADDDWNSRYGRSDLRVRNS